MRWMLGLVVPCASGGDGVERVIENIDRPTWLPG